MNVGSVSGDLPLTYRRTSSVARTDQNNNESKIHHIKKTPPGRRNGKLSTAFRCLSMFSAASSAVRLYNLMHAFNHNEFNQVPTAHKHRELKPDMKLNILAFETETLDKAEDKMIHARALAKKTGVSPSTVIPELRFEETAKKYHNIEFAKIGENTPFDGYSGKWAKIYDHLAKSDISDDAQVVVCDNRDVMLNLNVHDDPKEAVDTFVDYLNKMAEDDPEGNPVLISTEEGCCVGALSYAKPGDFFTEQGIRKKDLNNETLRACNSGVGNCTWRYVEEYWTSEKLPNGTYLPMEKRNIDPNTGKTDLNTYVQPWSSSQKAIAMREMESQGGEHKGLMEKVKTFY